MAESYSRLFSLNIIGLRFFTVYGPWGRPDMAIWKFTDSILKNNAINIFNKGTLERDFTYVDDIITGIKSALFYETNKRKNKHIIFNLGNNKPVTVNKTIKLIEKILNKKAKENTFLCSSEMLKRLLQTLKKLKENLITILQ